MHIYVVCTNYDYNCIARRRHACPPSAACTIPPLTLFPQPRASSASCPPNLPLLSSKRSQKVLLPCLWPLPPAHVFPVTSSLPTPRSPWRPRLPSRNASLSPHSTRTPSPASPRLLQTAQGSPLTRPEAPSRTPLCARGRSQWRSRRPPRGRAWAMTRSVLPDPIPAPALLRSRFLGSLAGRILTVLVGRAGEESQSRHHRLGLLRVRLLRRRVVVGDCRDRRGRGSGRRRESPPTQHDPGAGARGKPSPVLSPPCLFPCLLARFLERLSTSRDRVLSFSAVLSTSVLRN